MTTLSAELVAILACPSDDHAPLRVETSDDDVETLVCTCCLSRFGVSDGIPVLLADEAQSGPNGLGVPATSPSAASGVEDAR
jgi:uncharacterized protein